MGRNAGGGGAVDLLLVAGFERPALNQLPKKLETPHVVSYKNKRRERECSVNWTFIHLSNNPLIQHDGVSIFWPKSDRFQKEEKFIIAAGRDSAKAVIELNGEKL